MASSFKSAAFLIESRLVEAAFDPETLYELGVAYSTGSRGVDVDLIEAHKWFNLASAAGSTEAQEMRAEIADEMTAREIVEAQKMARAWLATHQRRAA
jgi:TPR repeat protein